MRAALQPFAFDRLFTPGADAPHASADAATLQAEIAELRAAQSEQIEQARAEAFSQALAQAREEQSAALLAATDALQASLDLIEDRFEQVEQRIAREAAELALAAAEQLAGDAVSSAPLAAIEGALDRALQQVHRGTPIRVVVHPDMTEAIEQAVAGRQARDRRRLHLHVAGDPAVPAGDARLVWDEGSLTCSAEQRREALAAEWKLLFPDD